MAPRGGARPTAHDERLTLADRPDEGRPRRGKGATKTLKLAANEACMLPPLHTNTNTEVAERLPR